MRPVAEAVWGAKRQFNLLSEDTSSLSDFRSKQHRRQVAEKRHGETPSAHSTMTQDAGVRDILVRWTLEKSGQTQLASCIGSLKQNGQESPRKDLRI